MELNSDMAHFKDSPEADEALGYGSEPEPDNTPDTGHVDTEGTPNDDDDWDGVEADDMEYDEEESMGDSQASQVDGTTPPQKIFGKYDTIEQAEEGFRNLGTAYGRQSQEVGQLRQAVNHLYGILQQQVAEQRAQAQPQQDVDPSALWERLAEDPRSTIAEMVQPIVEQRVAQERAMFQQALGPVYQMAQQMQMQQVSQQMEAHFSEQVRQLAAKHSDVGEYVDKMVETINNNPQLITQPGGYEIVYKLAKSDSIDSANAKAQERTKKSAVRLPQTGARVTQQRSRNDELAEEALGPIRERGLWG